MTNRLETELTRRATASSGTCVVCLVESGSPRSSHLDNVAGRHGDLPCHHRSNDRSGNARSARYTRRLRKFCPECKAWQGGSQKRTPPGGVDAPEGDRVIEEPGLASPPSWGEAPRHRQRRGCFVGEEQEGIVGRRGQHTCAPFATSPKNIYFSKSHGGQILSLFTTTGGVPLRPPSGQ